MTAEALEKRRAAFALYAEQLAEFRTGALTKISYVVDVHGNLPVPNNTLRNILNKLNIDIMGAATTYEAEIQRIEEAYK